MLADWLTPDPAAAQDAQPMQILGRRCGRGRRMSPMPEAISATSISAISSSRRDASSTLVDGSARSARDPVERALQDESRGGGVDFFRALLSRQSASIMARSAAAVESRSSQSTTGRSRQRREVAEEGARRLGARTLGAVHVDRQAEDEPADFLARAEREERLGVLGEFRAADGVERRGDLQPRIGERDADRLGAEVEPGEPRAGRQPPASVFDRDFGAGRCHLPRPNSESPLLSSRFTMS